MFIKMTDPSGSLGFNFQKTTETEQGMGGKEWRKGVINKNKPWSFQNCSPTYTRVNIKQYLFYTGLDYKRALSSNLKC